METFRPWPARISLRRRRGQGISALRAGAWRNELIELSPSVVHLCALSLDAACLGPTRQWHPRHWSGCSRRTSIASRSPWQEKQRKQSRSDANQSVTPGMSHVIPGRECHMLPFWSRNVGLETPTSEVQTRTSSATL